MRSVTIARKTAETDINLTLNLDGKGAAEIKSGVGFLDHMLTLFAKHARFDLTLTCKGDVEVDYHHTAEDIGIALGSALHKALGDMKGITRYGNFLMPMDETLVLSAVDISGRSHLSYAAEVKAKKVGDFDTELVEEFFEAFVRNAKLTLHIMKLSGKNSHHILEAVYKSVARSLKQAVAIEEAYQDEIPSTKGVL